MSKVAGILMILLGLGAAFIGIREVLQPDQLTPLARFSTLGIGAALVLVGLAHFRAPHKAFLMSVPLLLYFHVQMYLDSLFYFNKPGWEYQAILGIVSILIVVLSYRGYVQSRESAARGV
jgi:hypothetical protein